MTRREVLSNADDSPETDTEGPSGTTGCGCVAEDAHACYAKRYGVDPYVDEEGEVCECLCHIWVMDSDEPAGQSPSQTGDKS